MQWLSYLEEIIEELARTYQIDFGQIIVQSVPVISSLANKGLLWIRSQRMHKIKVDPPSAVTLNLTSRCNLSCRHCAVSAGHSGKEELSLELCLRLIDELAAPQCTKYRLKCGEPLIHPIFSKYLSI